MVDVHDKKTRSYNMSRIKSRDTKPEMAVRSVCHSLGLRFRLHDKNLPGRPDLVFRKHMIAIQVHGCYWHCHDCKYGRVTPKTNTEKWQLKRFANVARDVRTKRNLEDLGWRVLVIWECETRDLPKLASRISNYFGVSNTFTPTG